MRLVRLPLLAMLLALAGCDRRPPRFPVPQPSKAAERVDVQIVAPLLPDRPTHLARADDGTIWWVQETDGGGGDDVAFALGDDGVPRATALTSKTILSALEIPNGAGGNIQSLTVGADGRVWFYFAGGAGRRDVAAVGSFNPTGGMPAGGMSAGGAPADGTPATGALRIVADTDALRKATGMGASLVLARGSVVRSGADDAVWAWVRHSDASVLFRIDVKTGALAKPFDGPRADAGPIGMTRPGQQLGGSPGGLLLLDVPGAELWRIDAKTGRAASLHTLTGLPRVLSAPAMDSNQRAFLFAADAPLIPARSDEEAMKPVLAARYPALLVLEDGVLRAVGQDAIRVPSNAAPEDVRVQQLIADPANDAVIGYDETSGALLRFRIVRAE